MKKIIKTAAVLIALALMSAACSKVKTTSLIGTYKSGPIKMEVSSQGYVNIDTSDIPSDTSDENAKKLKKLGSSDIRIDGELIPWDLTSEKTAYEYTVEKKDEARNSSSVPGVGSPEQKPYTMTAKFNFTKDKESVKCDVSISVNTELSSLQDEDKNISLTFTK